MDPTTVKAKHVHKRKLNKLKARLMKKHEQATKGKQFYKAKDMTVLTVKRDKNQGI